jgi:transposase
LEDYIAEIATKDERILPLIQIPGIGLIIAITISAVIGDIRRFPAPSKLVGYAGLGVRVITQVIVKRAAVSPNLGEETCALWLAHCMHMPTG